MWDEASVEARFDASFRGVWRLNGCDPASLVPNTSCGSMLPLILSLPIAIVWPTATVPSWQAKHNMLARLMIGCMVVFWAVSLVYKSYGWVERVWFQRVALAAL